MRKPATMQEARAFVEELRRELLRQKRTVGDPRAPMRARPGQEEAFEKVEANLARAELIKSKTRTSVSPPPRATGGISRSASPPWSPTPPSS